MADHDDGGPAYPIPVDDRPGAYEAHPGMSLRDWFAGQALAGLCGNPGGPFQANERSGWAIVNCSPEFIADECYKLADAMIAAKREREGRR